MPNLTQSTLKLFDDYHPLKNLYGQYMCSECSNFNTTRKLNWLRHLRQCNPHVFENLVEERKKSRQVLNVALNNMAHDEEDDQGTNGHSNMLSNTTARPSQPHHSSGPTLFVSGASTAATNRSDFIHTQPFQPSQPSAAPIQQHQSPKEEYIQQMSILAEKWKQGLISNDTYYTTSEQLTKQIKTIEK